jgi:tetrahydromethanopterin S-methyltransferase subunit G
MLVIALLFVHSAISWVILILATHTKDLFLAYIPPFLFGVASTLFFLYIFNHDDVIKVAKYLEVKEKKVEKTWLKRFAKTGKVISTLLIGIFLGPIVAALTIKLLLPKYKGKYALIVLINLFSTAYFVSVLKGAALIFL